MDPNSTDASTRIPITTRRATVEDAQNLARLAGELGNRTTPEELAGRVAELARDPETAVFVAVDAIGEAPADRIGARPGGNGNPAGDLIVGWVHVLVMKTLLGARRAHLGGLVVDERYRGQKVGRVLLAVAEAWAAEQGCAEMVLRSRHSRERAHAFYEGHGYVRTKTQHVFKRVL